MKFKKQEMMRLSPQAVTDYLRAQDWYYRCDVGGKGAIWWYRDDEGGEYEIMLPINRELGDFAIRMSEAISTLEEVEQRDAREVYSTLAEIETLPSEIFEGEIAAEEGLRWNPDEKSRLGPLTEALNENSHKKASLAFLECLATMAAVLSRGPALIGNERSKEAAVWRSCEKVLFVAGWRVKDDVSETGFWNAAQAGDDVMEIWFGENLRKEPDAPARQGNVPSHG
jgi:hypothetical protein